jgi:pyruvate dehydrogenase E1 component beta subunit
VANEAANAYYMSGGQTRVPVVFHIFHGLRGGDVTVVATSYAVQSCLKVADRLAKENIEVEVIDPRTLVPFDLATILSSIEKTHRVVLVDETHQSCGVAAEIAARIAESGFDKLKTRIRRVSTLDVPVPFSPPLEEYIGPREDRITDAIRAAVA